MLTRLFTSERASRGPVRDARRRAGPVGLLLVAAASAVLLAACSSSSSSSSTTSTTVNLSGLQRWPTTSVSLTESGSTLLQPLFTTWAGAISTAHPTVTVQPSGGGSGQGISNAASGTSNIGASDAYLSQAQATQYPGLQNIPVAISAQQANYNLPGLPPTTHLKLDGKVLSAMYQGTITNWNSPQVTALNPGVTIPSVPVVPIHRTDASGDTFLWTSYLAAADPTGWGQKFPPNTTEQWPAVPGASGQNGNGGMVTGCASTPGCIAYIGVSYLDQASAKGLGYAALANKSNNYVLPTTAGISAEAAGYANSTPKNGAVSMIYGTSSTPSGYPIVNYEYAIVGKQPDTTHAQAVKAVLSWAVQTNGGNSPTYLNPVHFVALPSQVRQIALTQMSKIS